MIQKGKNMQYDDDIIYLDENESIYDKEIAELEKNNKNKDIFPTLSDENKTEDNKEVVEEEEVNESDDSKSSSSYAQTLRVLELLELLFKQKGTKKELKNGLAAQGIKVSPATLDRDLKFLSDASYIETYQKYDNRFISNDKEEYDSLITPELMNEDSKSETETSRKTTTYYKFRDMDFFSPKAKFSEEDYRVFKAIKDANNTLIDPDFLDKAEVLQRKIKVWVSNPNNIGYVENVDFDEDSERLTIFKEIWNYVPGLYDYKTGNTLVFELLKSISKRNILRVHYYKAKEENLKYLEAVPMSFYIFDGTLYLILYSLVHKNFISLTVHFIDRVEVINPERQDIPDLELDQFLKNRFGVYEEKAEKVKLRIKKDYVRYFENRKWHPSQKTRKINTGDLIIEMEVPLTTEFVAWIIKWTDAIVVDYPLDLIIKVKEGARRILANYEKK